MTKVGDDELLDFREAEKICIAAYRAAFAPNYELREYLAQMLVEGQARIQGSGEHVVSRGLLWQRVVRHFNASESLVRRGYYSEALIIFRSVFEVLGLIELFERFPDQAVRWFRGEDFRPAYVRNQLQATAERSEIYDYLSRRSHPNIEALIASAGGMNTQGSAPAHTAPWPAYLPELAEQITFVADVSLLSAVRLMNTTVIPNADAVLQRRWAEQYVRAEQMWEDLHPVEEEAEPAP